MPSASESSDSEKDYTEVHTKSSLEEKLHTPQKVDKTLPSTNSPDADKVSNTDEDRDRGTDDSSDDEGKDVTQSQISVKSCVKGPKRKWYKRHYCVYCKKPQSKMARHLQRKHINEKEVALAMCHSPKSKQRRQMLEDLRRKGNYYHNIEVLKEGKGEIITYRQPTEHVGPDEYLPCDMFWVLQKS